MQLEAEERLQRAASLVGRAACCAIANPKSSRTISDETHSERLASQREERARDVTLEWRARSETLIFRFNFKLRPTSARYRSQNAEQT